MPIKDTTNWNALNTEQTAFIFHVAEVLTRIAEYLGALFVTWAREMGTYHDRTGNLRSSVQASVSAGGESKWSSDGGVVLEGSAGKEQGLSMASEIASSAQGDIIRMAGVAAMPYAVYVEAKGFDVISGAALRTEAALPRLLNNSFSDTIPSA